MSLAYSSTSAHATSSLCAIHQSAHIASTTCVSVRSRDVSFNCDGLNRERPLHRIGDLGGTSREQTLTRESQSASKRS
jgi:hypothetical protein